MASRPIELEIRLDSGGVDKGADKIADSFKGIGDEAKDSGKAVERAGSNIEDAAKAAGRAVEAAGNDMESAGKDAASKFDRDLTRALEDVSHESRKTGKDLGDNMRRGAREANEATRTIAEEGRQNLSETVSSFRGDIEDIPQLMQDIAGGVVSDLGPIGAVFGTALAAGLGIAVAGLQKNAEEVQKNKELVLDLAQAIQDAGGDLNSVDFQSRMQDWGKAIQDTKEWWELFQDDAKTGFEVIQDRAKKTGEIWTDVFKGTKGTMDDSKDYLEKTGDTFNALQQKIDDAGGSYDEFGHFTSFASQELLTARDALKQNREEAEKNISTQQKAQDAVAASNELTAAGASHWHGYSDAEKAAQASADAVTKAKKEELDAMKAVSDEMDRQSGKAKDSITAENDLAQAYDDSAQALKDNGATHDVATEKGRANRDMLVDLSDKITANSNAQIANGQSIDAATSSMEAQRAKFIDAAVAAGYSRDEAAKLADQLNLTPKAVQTHFQSNAAEEKQKATDYANTLKNNPTAIYTDVNLNGIPDAEEQLRRFIAPGRHLYVNVATGDTSALDNYIAGMNGKRVYVDVVPKGGGVGITN